MSSHQAHLTDSYPQAGEQRLSKLFGAQSQIIESMVRARSFEELCAEICRILVEEGGVACALVRLHDPESDLLLPVAFHGPFVGLIGRSQLSASSGTGVSALAFQTRRPVLIEDVLGNPITVHINSEAVQMGVRSAAAFPLEFGDHARGTLALFAVGTHFFDPELANVLARTARAIAFAEAKLAAESMLAARERDLRLAQEAGRIGSTIVDLKTGMWTTSEVGRQILGLDGTRFRTLAEFETLLAPAGRAQASAAMRAHVVSGGHSDQVYQFIHQQSGLLRWMRVVSDTERAPDGTPLRRIGTLQDVTEQQLAVQRTERLSRLYAALSQTNAAIVRGEDFDSLCETICRIVVEQGGLIGATVRLHNPATAMLEMVAHHGPRIGPPAWHATGMSVDDPVGLAAMAFRYNKRFLVRSISDHMPIDRLSEEARAKGVNAGSAFPIRDKHQPFGTFTILAPDPDSCDEEMAILLEEIADAIAFARNKLVGEASRQEAEGRYRTLVEHSLNSILLLDGEIVEYANPATAAIVGFASVREPLGVNVLSFIVPSYRTAVSAAIKDLMARSGETLSPLRLQLLHRNGSIVDVMGTAASIDLNGKILIQLELRDVTRERQALAEAKSLNETLEARVHERTGALSASNHALEAANRRLEAFSYSVAHDLRAPLRSMIGFAKLLEIDIAEGDLSEVGSHTERISASATRMNSLIDGLLAVARATHQAMEDLPIDHEQLVREVAQDMVSGSGIQLTLGALPRIRGDAIALRQVWTNLLSNAVKYSAKQAQPVIEVAGAVRGTELVFQVRDNGAGFDPAYADRLFGVFQRLHSADDFDGTGVGLAIVQSIVERHGGRVWAEGRPGKGATFCFALPGTRAAPMPL